MTVSTYLATPVDGYAQIILLNDYPFDQPDDFSVYVVFRAHADIVRDESGGGGQGTPRSIRYDEWVPMTVIVDLDDLRFDVFYAGEIIRSGATWSSDPNRNLIAATEFADGNLSIDPAMYVDDYCLEKVRGAESSALSMTPNPFPVTGTQLRIDADAPELPNATSYLFVTAIAGVPFFAPVFPFAFDANGHFGLDAPVPSGIPAPLDIAFKTFSAGSQGLTESNEMRVYFR